MHSLLLVDAGNNQTIDWLSDKCFDDRPKSLSKDAENTTIQNPYYEGDLDVLAQGNDRSRINTLCPDTSDVDIVTSSQNIYYEL